MLNTVKKLHGIKKSRTFASSNKKTINIMKREIKDLKKEFPAGTCVTVRWDIRRAIGIVKGFGYDCVGNQVIFTYYQINAKNDYTKNDSLGAEGNDISQSTPQEQKELFDYIKANGDSLDVINKQSNYKEACDAVLKLTNDELLSLNLFIAKQLTKNK